MLDGLIFAAMVLISIVIVGTILVRLYQKATKELAFVRTGLGGQKVIKDGGAMVLPGLHNIIHVNMNTLRLEVSRINQEALITKDRMRVDVKAEFFVRVQPSVDAIANAAQTLGAKTMKPTELKELVEGKFVDALRSVAAQMAMEELHEQRASFVQKVQNVVAEDILKNGLELESVSLTGLDQTKKEFFNPANVFDAEGLTKMTEAIEARRKKRNDIERDTEIQIRQKDLETTQFRLTIDREEAYATMEQDREIAVRLAEQEMLTAKEQAEKNRQAEEARIESERLIEQSRIEKDRQIEEARINKTRDLEAAEIEKKKLIEQAEIGRVKAVELARQDQEIAIAEKSKEQSLAKKQADEARALAISAEEKVITARDTEIATRQKAIELIEAARTAEREAIGITVAAKAEEEAATANAEAARKSSQGQADAIKILAAGEAEAVLAKANADERMYQVEAEGRQKINQAANTLSPSQIEMQIRIKLLETLPAIISESVKPMENIDSIRIVQMDGMGPAVHGGNGDGSGAGLADSVVNSALRYRAMAPLVDQLMTEAGLNGLLKGQGLAALEKLENDGSASAGAGA